MNSVEKALVILEAFSIDRPAWGVRELADHLGFSPATVLRLLRSLKAYRFVDQDPETRHYRLGNIYLHFLHILQSTYPVMAAAKPLMKILREKTRETVHLNLINGQERICIHSLESMQQLKATMPIGNEAPLYAGASSKCLLAFSPAEFIADYVENVALTALTPHTITDAKALLIELERIRARGYATSLAETTPGLGALSTPLFNQSGTLLASLSLAIPEMRYNDPVHRDFCVQELLATARELCRSL